MSDESQIDRQLRKQNAAEESGGPSINMEDKRVSSAINWVLAGVGSGVIWVLWHFGSQFSEEIGLLRTELVKTNTQLAISIAQNARLENDVKDHEARLRTLEGRNLRGGPEKERTNGR